MGLLDDLNNAVNPVTIDQFKATIGKRGGIASSNRFAVTITPPSQPLLNLDFEAAAAAAISGNFNLGTLVNDPRDINILCQSATLPGRAIATGDYDPYGTFTVKIPHNLIDQDVDFTFTLTNDYYVKKFFYDWQRSIINKQTDLLSYDAEYRTDVTIQQLDKKNTPVYAIKLIDAFPVGVNAIELSNNETDSVLTVTVTMTYTTFEEVGAVKSIINTTKDKLNTFKRLL
jgi:hypothetical protein